ncbi:MAG: hypothetical protein Q8R28_12000, partial [Dehalococcoidia bacterium]|nr:hypothetical protein [Dehalococcoidia bacterium]
DGGVIATAQAAYCGTSTSAIRASTTALDAFNQSGDMIPLGFSTPAATPKLSRSQADIPFWDTTTNEGEETGKQDGTKQKKRGEAVGLPPLCRPQWELSSMWG